MWEEGTPNKEIAMRDLTHLYNVANDMMGKLGLWEIIDRKLISAEELGELCGGQVSEELRKRSPAKLGELAACGRAVGDRSEVQGRGRARTCLAAVHPGQAWLNANGSGYGLLLRIATTTVLAAMTDVIEKRFPTGTWIDDYPTPERRKTSVPHASTFQS